MNRKKTWTMTGVRVGMFWPRATVVTISAYLPDDGNRELEARLTLTEARDLRDTLSGWLKAAETATDHA